MDYAVPQQLENTLCSLAMIPLVAESQAELQLTVSSLKHLNIHKAGSGMTADEFNPFGGNPFNAAYVLHAALIADSESVVFQNLGCADDKGVVRVIDALSGLIFHFS